jgi:histone acetyltransferase (RNA polymerase elongator complex component)
VDATRCNRSAAFQMVNAIQYEVMGPVTVMRVHRQLPELLIAHRVGSGEVAHTDDIGFEQLVYGRIRVGRIKQRHDHALIDCN